MNVVVFFAALALDFTVGFLGSKAGGHTPHVRALSEVVEEVGDALAVSDYDGLTVEVAIAATPGPEQIWAYTMYQPMSNDFKVVFYPRSLVLGKKAFRQIVAHEVCHLVHDRAMLMEPVSKLDDKERKRVEEAAWACAEALRKKVWR